MDIRPQIEQGGVIHALAEPAWPKLQLPMDFPTTRSSSLFGKEQKKTNKHVETNLEIFLERSGKGGCRV